MKMLGIYSPGAYFGAMERRRDGPKASGVTFCLPLDSPALQLCGIEAPGTSSASPRPPVARRFPDRQMCKNQQRTIMSTSFPDDDLPGAEMEALVPEYTDFVLDSKLRQVFAGDYILLPCFNSMVDRAMVVAINGSLMEFMIILPDTGIPETHVMDTRRPDPQTGLFDRYGYTGFVVCARRGEPAARDFARQLLASCLCEGPAGHNPRFNPYLAAQAKSRVEFLKRVIDIA
jgi:hypothetical protein